MSRSNDGSESAAVPIPPDARDRVVEVLTRGFADDQLSEEQLETLLDRVYRATTLDELSALIANLPVRQPATPGAGPIETSLEPQRAPMRIRALLSGQEPRLTGVVPRNLQLRARLGYVELDLTQATFEPGVTAIDVRALWGYVQVRFPANVQVENDGDALLGFFSVKGGGSTGAAECIVHVTGRAIMGFAECLVKPAGPERA